MVTPKHVEQDRREGYTIVDPFLSAAEMDRIQEYMDPFIAEQARHMRPEHLDKVHVWDKHFLDFCSLPRILDAVAQFIGPNIVLFSSHIISKAQGDGLAVPWHQDGVYWPLEPMDVITLWLAVDDSTVANGCMRVIPGTQTQGPIGHRRDDHPEDKVLDQKVPDEHVNESQAVNCALKRGGASFHHPYIIHGSTPNRSPQRRCGYTMRFMPAETKMPRTGPLARWFGQHPLFLLRGRDAQRTNVYANVT